MARAVVQIDGARELRQELKRAGDGMQAMKEAHRETAEVVAPVARTRVPRRSGRLAGSIRTSGTASAAIVRAGRASVPYAAPIHFGWPARNIEAQPFISDAARKTEPRWLALYKRHIDRLLSKIKGASQ